MVTNRAGRGTFTLAVRALVRIAEDPAGIVRSEEVAREIGAHPVVLRRLLSRLRLAGFVEGRSGPGGGWSVARDPSTISLGRVHRALADPMSHDANDRLAGVFIRAEQAFEDQLDRTSIADLMGEHPETDL